MKLRYISNENKENAAKSSIFNIYSTILLKKKSSLAELISVVGSISLTETN